MKNNFKLVRNLLMLGVTIFLLACSEEFTEEDALKAQQTIDLAVYVVDGTSDLDSPIEGATVTVSQGGKTIEVITDASGVAMFPDFGVGSFVYNVSADNYLSESNLGNAIADNIRVGQITARAELISMKDENLATIKGNITVDTDVTNLTKEAAADVMVYFDVYLYGRNHIFSAITDTEGNYEAKIPTNGSDGTTYVELRYSDFEANQTIAVNKFECEVGVFPEVLPRIETIKTLYSSSTTGALNKYFYEGYVRSMYAVADSAPEGGAQAIIDYVYTNDEGEVTGLYFADGGNYMNDEDGLVNIQIFSLDGGSEASVSIVLGDQGDLEDAYYENGTAITTLNPGSGYPDSNETLNKIDYRNPSFVSSVELYPGSIKIVNGDYGTGIYRPRKVL